VIYVIAVQEVTTHEQIGVLGTGWRFIASSAGGIVVGAAVAVVVTEVRRGCATPGWRTWSAWRPPSCGG